MHPEHLIGRLVVLVLGLVFLVDDATTTFFRLLRAGKANALKALEVYLHLWT